MFDLSKLTLISFEIGIGCNLKSVHKLCPINKIERKKDVPRLDVESICKAMDEANELGFQGHFAFHHYNEPLLDMKRIAEIVKLRPNNKYLLWSNGLLVPKEEADGYTLDIFDKIVFTLYDEKDRPMLEEVKKRYQNVDIYDAEMDERLEIYDKNYENIVSCKKVCIEMPISNEGEVCLCTHDWNNSHKIGNILTSSFKEVILGEAYQNILKAASKHGVSTYTPEICHRCKYAHLLKQSEYTKI